MKFAEWSGKFNEQASALAAAESKRLALPQSADLYKPELPADFKVPDGITFALNEADPLLAQARSLAHEAGLTQEQFSKFLGLYAGSQVATQQQIVAARNAEVAKLGANGPARFNALEQFFTSYLGQAEGKQVMSRVATAGDVQILEKLVGKITTQGGAGLTGRGREPPEPQGRMNADQIARLTPAQRLDYVRQFDQRNMPAWQDPRSNGAAA